MPPIAFIMIFAALIVLGICVLLETSRQKAAAESERAAESARQAQMERDMRRRKEEQMNLQKIIESERSVKRPRPATFDASPKAAAPTPARAQRPDPMLDMANPLNPMSPISPLNPMNHMLADDDTSRRAAPVSTPAPSVDHSPSYSSGSSGGDGGGFSASCDPGC